MSKVFSGQPTNNLQELLEQMKQADQETIIPGVNVRVSEARRQIEMLYFKDWKRTFS